MPSSSEDEKESMECVYSNCVVCKAEGVNYRPNACECIAYCKKCAMKMASGGKCKVCTAWYSGFIKVDKHQ